MRWVDIEKEGQPKVTAHNPYPTHYVRLLCVSRPVVGLKSDPFANARIVPGQLRLFGRDERRPNWVSAETHTPLENDAWVVTHYLDGDITQLEGWPELNPQQ